MSAAKKGKPKATSEELRMAQGHAREAIAYLHDANERLADAYSCKDADELVSVMSCITSALSNLRAIYPHAVELEARPQ